VRPADLAQALIALPPGAWRYGRVIAVAESPVASRKDRQIIRRNVEATIQQLNDLGVRRRRVAHTIRPFRLIALFHRLRVPVRVVSANR